MTHSRCSSLREKFPHTEFFLVRIFLYSDTEKYGSEKILNLDTFHAVRSFKATLLPGKQRPVFKSLFHTYSKEDFEKSRPDYQNTFKKDS